ncbi:hypothetical protein HOY82DRAFT_479059 [Tuber indicum]|nr:hypothetical protein HOY82DRAFT_479059 [Tuber indicum]
MNTFIYTANYRDEKLGGLWPGSTFTNSNLYFMAEILCFFSDTFVIHDKAGQLVEKDGQQLQAGDYYLATRSITVNNEVPLTRLLTFQSGPRANTFRIAVRARDRGCVITGIKAQLAHLDIWIGFDAACIFPPAYEEQWKGNYGRWTTVPRANESDGSINSVQNGILQLNHMDKFFDSFQIAINPNDNYKVVCFSPGLPPFNIAGRSLDQAFLNDPLRPPTPLLLWHIRLAVLINMKGAGAHCFGDDVHPDPEMVGGALSGERGGKGLRVGCLVVLDRSFVFETIIL